MDRCTVNVYIAASGTQLAGGEKKLSCACPTLGW